jgi:hypothetical protein
MTDYAEDIKKYTSSVNEAAVKGLVKHLGIALRSRDSSLVSCSDKTELDRVRDGFMKKKLALTDGDDALDSALAEVCTKMAGDRSKSRVTFYYLVAEKYGKLAQFG